jgi:Raf kinase inhibitor-like YbhB/YbcL family protein
VDLPLFDAGVVEDAGTQDAGTKEDAGVAPFTLTSTVLTDGGVFPVRYTCADTTTTGRVSPPFAWTPVTNAQSYAMVMTDTSINLVHWIIWDIPATTLALPEGVQNVALPPTPAGARQTTSYDSTTYGYRGPCPPNPHVYRFELHALEVAALPGVTTASTRAQVSAALALHVLETTSLSASWGP